MNPQTNEKKCKSLTQQQQKQQKDIITQLIGGEKGQSLAAKYGC